MSSVEKISTITNNTAISLGLVLLIVSSIVYGEVRFAKVQSTVENNTNHLSRMQGSIDRFGDLYVSKTELLLRIDAIDAKLEAINAKLSKVN